MHVLMIEDDADSRSLFREVLADFGIGASCVGPDELPEPYRVDVVVTDLPDPRAPYSSAAAREWVGCLQARYEAPILVLTGHSEADADAQLTALARVIIKPIDIDAFVERLRTAARP